MMEMAMETGIVSIVSGLKQSQIPIVKLEKKKKYLWRIFH